MMDWNYELSQYHNPFPLKLLLSICHSAHHTTESRSSPCTECSGRLVAEARSQALGSHNCGLATSEMGLVSSSLYVSQLGHVVLKVCCVLILVTFILVCVWGGILHVRGQKRALDPSELETQLAVNHQT